MYVLKPLDEMTFWLKIVDFFFFYISMELYIVVIH